MKRFAIAGAICVAFLFAAMLPVMAQDDQNRDEHRDDKARQEEKHDQVKHDQDKHDQDKHDQMKHDQDKHDQAKNEEHRRISDDHFRSNFGREHHFAVRNVQIVEGRPHFSYGGYNFEIVEAWPVGWAYTDDCYIDFIDGSYFLFDLMHPGVRLEVVVL